MMLYIALLLCLAVFSPIRADDAEVVCDEAMYDEASRKLLFFANNELQPETSESLAESCLSDNKTFEWIEGYTKDCIKGVAGGVMRLMLDSAGKELHNRCYGYLRETYLEFTPCLNTVIKELHSCNRQMIVHIERTNEFKKPRQQIIHGCCSIQSYIHCLESQVRLKCNEETGQFMRDAINRVGDVLLDGHCARFTPDSQDCLNLPKPANDREPQHRSFGPAIVHVLKNYG